MDKAEVIIKLKKYKLLLSKEMAFEQMILFGSYAKETQREDSDVDVAIIVDKIHGDYFTTRPQKWDSDIGPKKDKYGDPSIFFPIATPPSKMLQRICSSFASALKMCRQRRHKTFQAHTYSLIILII